MSNDSRKTWRAVCGNFGLYKAIDGVVELKKKEAHFSALQIVLLQRRDGMLLLAQATQCEKQPRRNPIHSCCHSLLLLLLLVKNFVVTTPLN